MPPRPAGALWDTLGSLGEGVGELQGPAGHIHVLGCRMEQGWGEQSPLTATQLPYSLSSSSGCCNPCGNQLLAHPLLPEMLLQCVCVCVCTSRGV